MTANDGKNGTERHTWMGVAPASPLSRPLCEGKRKWHRMTPQPLRSIPRCGPRTAQPLQSVSRGARSFPALRFPELPRVPQSPPAHGSPQLPRSEFSRHIRDCIAAPGDHGRAMQSMRNIPFQFHGCYTALTVPILVVLTPKIGRPGDRGSVGGWCGNRSIAVSSGRAQSARTGT